MTVNGYHVACLPPEDGGGWLATVPDLPGCMSDGETVEEARETVCDAIACWLAAARRLGRAVPQPASVSERRA